MKEFPWLVYSPSLDGAFCLPCVLFAHDTGKRGVQLDRLLHKPVNFWTSATNKFKSHEQNSEVHKAAVLRSSDFKKSMENASLSINHQLDLTCKKVAEENRAKLSSVLKTIIFCGKQNIPLRGHCDDSKYYDSKQNTGNFQRLLEFHVDAGDHVLQEHCTPVLAMQAIAPKQYKMNLLVAVLNTSKIY